MANDGTKILDELKAQADGILAGDISADSNMLVEILSIASDMYYNADLEEEFLFTRNGIDYTVVRVNSFLLDSHYDALEKMLKAMDPNNSFLATVGSDVRGGKIPLPVTMGSLDQVYEGDTIVWINNNKWQNEKFVLTDKMDGTSGLVVYGKGGLLTIAYSRGNGIEGADITRHIKNIPSIPKKMPISCMVRVEIEMADEVFAKLMAERKKRGERVYENPRNYVAGRMNASESPQEFYDNVSAFATSLIEPEMGKLDQLEMLEKAGWTVPDYIVCKGDELVDEDLIVYLEGRRSKTKFAIDGIVIDLDDPEIRRSLYQTRSTLNPAYSKKFKVGSEENVAFPEVEKVIWRASKTGYLKPRIEIKPVSLGGVTITFATGFNAKFIKENIIGPGAIIQITRSGEVIPFVQKTIKPAPNGPDMPDEDEHGLLDWTDGDVDIFIVDPSDNVAVLLRQLNDQFGRMEVPHLRGGSIKKAVESGLNSAVKIIKATKQQLQNAIGESAGEKIFDGLKAKLNPINLYTLAGTSQLFGRGIGQRKMKKLIESLGEDDLLLGRLTVQQVVNVESFQLTTAQLVVNNQAAFLAFLKEIDGYYTLAKPKAPTSAECAGFAIIFTGVRDKELEQKIIAKGGSIASGVNSKTTHLVCKDKSSTSGKMVKAHEFAKAGTLEILDLGEARKRWG